jgi:acetyltransferase-like isoleucine patch superfamily enzyme
MKRILTPLQFVVTLFMFVEIAVVFGVSAFPAVSLWLWASEHLPLTGAGRTLALTILAALGYFASGVALMFVVPVARWLTLSFGTPLGKYPYASLKGYQWASYNALTLAVRYSFINWVRATPFLALFHRMMGMKIGARVQINTAVVSDQNLITIGDDTVVGGDVTLIAHSVEGPNIVTAPVKIGSHVTLGLMAVVLPGCEIGDHAMIAANAVLKKGTIVKPYEIWGGVPAERIGERSRPAG